MSYPGLLVSKPLPDREGWRIEVAIEIFVTQIITTDGMSVEHRW